MKWINSAFSQLPLFRRGLGGGFFFALLFGVFCIPLSAQFPPLNGVSTHLPSREGQGGGSDLFTLHSPLGESEGATLTIDIQQGGKIVSLKYGEQEMLSQLQRPEWFGSTFWTSPQREWNWPPVREFDKQPYTVELREDKHLTIVSPVSQRLGLRVTKDFTIPSSLPLGESQKGGQFLITYSITNEGSEPRSVAPWEITRVVNGDGIIFFDAPVDSIWPADLMTFTSAYGASWYKTDEAPRNRKINANASGWLAYCADGLLLVKQFQDMKPGEAAPGEAEVQVYLNQGKTYIELENQGPYTLLQPGEQLSWSVRWNLLPTKLPPTPSKKLMKLIQ